MDLNIHLRLQCPAAFDAAQKAATRVVEPLSREIDITSPESPHVPHITLFLGKFSGGDNAAACVERLAALLESEIGSHLGPVRVALTGGPLTAAGSYAFWDAERDEELTALADAVVFGVQALTVKLHEPSWLSGLPVAEQRARRRQLALYNTCLLYTSPSPRDRQKSRMPSSA